MANYLSLEGELKDQLLNVRVQHPHVDLTCVLLPVFVDKVPRGFWEEQNPKWRSSSWK